jgi:hypothetical protein
MSDTNKTAETTFACPDWCDRVDCGSFDIETETGQPTRAHEHVVTSEGGLFVWVTAKEWLTPAGPVLEPVTIGADAEGFDGTREMTPDQARVLEAALAGALALAHRIAGA